MELPDDFWRNIIEARIFAYTKSEEEQEEHIADDAMSFLLQFFGYPASQMDFDVLHTVRRHLLRAGDDRLAALSPRFRRRSPHCARRLPTRHRRKL